MLGLCVRRCIAIRYNTSSLLRTQIASSPVKQRGYSGSPLLVRLQHTMSTGKRIVFTGGSGKAGRHVIPELLMKGHRVLNLDLVPLDNPDVFVGQLIIFLQCVSYS